MGIFDNFEPKKNGSNQYTPANEAEAWVGVLFACVAVDQDVTSMEADTMSRVLLKKQIVQDQDLTQLYKAVFNRFPYVGSKAMIDGAVAFIPADSRPTVFTLACEVVLADSIMTEGEQELLTYLADALDLPGEILSKIIEVYLIRNRGNIAITG